MLNLETGVVNGLILENRVNVLVEKLADFGQGKMKPCSNIDTIPKRVLASFDILATLDYSEAYNFLINFKSKNEPIPVKL